MSLEKVKRFAEGLDALRIFPRLMMLCYCWLTYTTITWFMSLPDPTTAQAGLISVVTGASAAFFGLYVRKN